MFLSFGAHWVLVQYSHSIWMQLLVSFGGFLAMYVLAWVLDRAKAVPPLFVDINETLPEAASKRATA